MNQVMENLHHLLAVSVSSLLETLLKTLFIEIYLMYNIM